MAMEERLTRCNMSIGAGARCGMMAPDDTTYQYLHGKPFAPHGPAWDRAEGFWRTLPSDDGAVFDQAIDIDISPVGPMVTWGTSPDTAVGIDDAVPDPARAGDAAVRRAMEAALEYMDRSEEHTAG